MFRTSNPTLQPRSFASVTGAGQMTLSGTLGKTFVLLVLLMASATVGWATHSMLLMIVGVFGGLITAIATSFKPNWAPITAPLYSVLEGLAVGGISVIYAERMADTKYAGAVPLAILGTFLVFGVMLFLYATRVIKVNQTFLTIVMAGTIAIGVTYLVTMLVGMFVPGFYQLPIYRSGPIGIGFSLFVIFMAAGNLAIDFKVIEDGIASKAPKFMEWYAGFGLLVTLVWLYLEILRLLSKIAGRR
ncbi:MAG: Bax inhibitor-1/YccA family protein [Armatimonadetes bacterium]|nr:Bax inhibitor-1/YccA family protein [Armatimonadota bacterium]